MQALYFEEFGDASVLQYGEVPSPAIKQNEILVEMIYIGLNYADIYRRNGDYHIEEHTPYINGYEGLGTIKQMGSQVTGYEIGDKVFFVDVPFANAEFVAVPEEQAIRVPDELDDKVVASIGLQGLTADFLAHDLGRNQRNDKVFVHGISGGVGQILSQILTADNVNVYGVTSSQEKQALALNQGAKEVFLRHTDWEEGYDDYFDTVYDGVGITLNQSKQLLKNRGDLVFFGIAGGSPPSIDLIDMLTSSKSILTGDLWDFLDSRSERERRSKRLFDYFIKEQVIISEPTIFSLSDGRSAYEYLESGKSIGKILLRP